MRFHHDSEHALRQLAIRHFPLQTVQIIVDQHHRKECLTMLTDRDVQVGMKGDKLLFRGLGQDAGTLDQPLTWTSTPAWKKGLWLRRIQIPGADATTNVLEWDGCGNTPDVELAAPFADRIEWLGPLPPLNF